MQVRPVASSDVESIKWLGKILQEESPEYRNMVYSPEKVGAFVKDAADDQVDHITGWVAEEDGNVVGFIFAYTSTHIFFKDAVTWDGTLYLQPAYRSKNGRTIFKLLKNYVDWAEQWGGPIKFGLTTDIETERLEQMLHRFGFETTGRVLSYVRQQTRESRAD